MEYDIAGISLSNADGASIFENVFKSHFKRLHAYACTILRDEATAEEMVQNVFYKLWEKKEQLEVQQSVTAYLYRAVYHESLNYIKHTRVKAAHHAYTMHTSKEAHNPVERAGLKELEQRIDKALQELPEQCRAIFQMSRFEELKYREIADRLNISVKTVENQMGKALRIMREQLVDYLPIILLTLLNLL